MNVDSRIYVAGHLGLVGSALVRELKREGFKNLVVRTRAELELTDAKAVREFMEIERPEYVFLAAAKVGGIMANKTEPVNFLLQNLQVQNNVISSAHECGVKKLLFLGSSCIYPKFAPQPIEETSLLSGPLEPTNEWYAVAKIAGIKLCQAYRQQHGSDFISAMPTNLYGPNDNYDLNSSHVLPAMIRRFHEAKVSQLENVVLWGSGCVKREFLYVDDLARACIRLMMNYSHPEIINIGYGNDLTIRELAETISSIVGYRGRIEWDTSKPDGTPRKLLNSSRIQAMGWRPVISLSQGIELAYGNYLRTLEA